MVLEAVFWLKVGCALDSIIFYGWSLSFFLNDPFSLSVMGVDECHRKVLMITVLCAVVTGKCSVVHRGSFYGIKRGVH